MKKLLNSFKTRSFRVGGYSVFATVILVAIIVLVNVVVSSLPKRCTEIDTSGLKLYTLSEESRQLVKSLEQDITIYWLTTEEDETIGNLLDRYAGLSRHIIVEKVNPEENPAFIGQYDLTYYSNNSLIVDSGERFRYVKYTDIYVTEYDYTDMTYFARYDAYRSTTSFDGEGAVTSAINYVLYASLPKVYCLTGHGEQDLDNEFENGLMRENMELEDLSLIESGSVPEDCSVLLVHTPTGDLTEADMTAVQEYLDKGGRMMLITSPEQKENQRPNIQKMMAGYHVIEQSGFVLEGDSGYYQSGYPYYLLPSLQSHEITAPLKAGGYRVVVPFSSGLQIDAEDSLNVNEKVESLLHTTSESYSKSAGFSTETFDRTEDDVEGPFELGVVIEQLAENSTTTKIVWFTSEFIADEKASELVAGGNQDLFTNAMSYLTENKSGISIHAKNLAEDYLQVTNSVATFWEIIVIAVIPALFLALGIWQFIRRRRK